MTSTVDSPRRRWWLPALTLFMFFFLLGSRSLNEPDEGRYAEIAREMIELKDWLVPHLWYVPHLDKPPLTYWAVAVSISVLGQNEWAVRLPLALAGISGVWVSYLFGLALGGQRVAVWSALILQSSLLYFVMARMLTTDILLTQFIAWAIYFFWRSWRCLDGGAEESPPGRKRRTRRFFALHLAGWTAAALGFLTKGPIAFLLPIVSLALNLVPFAFPGNLERVGDRLLKDEAAMIRLLSGKRRVLVVGVSGTLNHFQLRLGQTPLTLCARVGQWELFANR